MRQNTVKMTTAQFAELHGVNRRTLHYYDDIGLFSPCQKGENGYRYYDASQSIVFEYIRMLKELNMSIAEIADYCKHPAPEKFLQIADRKEAEIDLEIRRLKRARNILKTKKAQVRLCEGLPDEEIRVEECGAVKISVLPYDFSGDDLSRLFTDLNKIDVILVPGVAFDRTLNRLGRGKGFYDKILSQTKACKIGICFDFQLLDRIPTEVHDVRMTQVISSR